MAASTLVPEGEENQVLTNISQQGSLSNDAEIQIPDMINLELAGLRRSPRFQEAAGISGRTFSFSH